LITAATIGVSRVATAHAGAAVPRVAAAAALVRTAAAAAAAAAAAGGVPRLRLRLDVRG